MRVLVTGSAGFIGYHLVKKLIERGDEVIGLDNLNDYYEVELKYGRLNDTGINKEEIEYNKLVKSRKYSNYQFIKLDLSDKDKINSFFENEKFDTVSHLAAQAGVRYSISNPYIYIESNIVGFINILECCRNNNIKHLIFASSSSVYGLNKKIPFSTSDNVDHPVSLYAASKKSNELMAHSYSHLYNIPITGLRFFTVYGPWGRPDMAYFKFTKAIFEGKSIDVYNSGNMQRDFTYITDIINGIEKVIEKPSTGNENWNGENPDPATSKAPYRIYNIGHSVPVNLLDFIKEIEKASGQNVEKNMMPMQPGDVPVTYADVSDLIQNFGYKPLVNIEDGIKKFVKWYKDFYKV